MRQCTVDLMTALEDLGVSLDDLIRAVTTSRPDGDAIARLGLASTIAQQLGELGDHLVGHFVDAARAAGESWRSIGAGMGVTKQAVQKRFTPASGDAGADALLARFTPRARHVLQVARGEARRLRAVEVAPEHLVLALLAERDGLAAKALAAHEVDFDAVRRQIEAVAVASTERLPDQIPFGARVKKVLEVALREALRLLHNYIGTEHLLLAVLADPTSGGGFVLEHGVTREEAVAWITDTLAEYSANRSS
jgi:hypothetical protein